MGVRTRCSRAGSSSYRLRLAVLGYSQKDTLTLRRDFRRACSQEEGGRRELKRAARSGSEPLTTPGAGLYGGAASTWEEHRLKDGRLFPIQSMSAVDYSGRRMIFASAA